MVWGCISMSAKSVGWASRINVKGTMDTSLYLQVLEDEMQKSVDWCFDKSDKGEWFFQQDNATCHKSQAVLKFLNDKKIKLLDHPPQSPDLNPIESLWNHIKHQINKKHIMNGVEDIWSAFEEELNKIPPDYCEKLIRSMPERIQAVLKAKGVKDQQNIKHKINCCFWQYKWFFLFFFLFGTINFDFPGIKINFKNWTSKYRVSQNQGQTDSFDFLLTQMSTKNF